MAGLPPGPQSIQNTGVTQVAGTPPEQVDQVLRTMQAAQQDEFLANLPDADLKAYADWSAKNNPAPQGKVKGTDVKGYRIVHGEAAQPDPTRQPTEDELSKMSDEQLAKLAAGESVSTDEVAPGGNGWLDNKAGQVIRAGVTGAAALPLMLFDKIAEVPGVTGGSDAGDAVGMAGDWLGLGRPKTSGERVLSDVVSGVTGALATGGVGGMAPGVGGRILGADLGKQALSGALGGGAAGVTRENGGGAGAQLIAGLAGGLSPQIIEGTLGNAARRVIRGGPEGLNRMKGNIADFEQAGTFPSVGQATEGTRAREVEAFLSRLYGSSGRMRRFGSAQEDAIGSAVRGKVETLDPSGTASPTTAGERIVQDYEGSFRPAQRATIDQAYNDFDKLLEASPPPRQAGPTRIEADTARTAEERFQQTGRDLTEAQKALREARTAEILRLSRRPDTYDENVLRATAADPGARARVREASSDVTLAETRVAQLEAAREEARKGLRSVQAGDHVTNTPFVPLTRTVAKFRSLVATIPGAENISTNRLLSPNRNQYVNALKDLLQDIDLNGGNGLPFDAVKKLRTRIGDRLADSVIDASIPSKELRGLYGTLSEDLKDAARSAGPQVEEAFATANATSSAFHDHLELIKNIVEKNGGGEKVFQSAMSGTPEGATALKAIYSTMQPDGRSFLSAAIIRRMAKSTAGTGVTQGDFNLQNFFKNYEAMSPEARAQVFGRLPGTMKEDFDKIAKVAFNIREGREEFGAATKAAEGRTGLQGLLYPLMMAGGTAVGLGSPKVAGAAAAGAGIVFGGSRYLANKMTDPKFVKWLAKTNSIPKSALPAAINQLAQQARRDHDDDLVAVAEDLKKQEQGY